MARNNKAKSGSDFGDGYKKPVTARSGQQSLIWVAPYVDQNDLKWLENERPNISGVILEFLSDLPEGYSLSSKFDDKTDRWLTTCICSRSGDPNEGIALTARGSTRINSAYTLAYIAVFKLEWKWRERGDNNSGDFG